MVMGFSHYLMYHQKIQQFVAQYLGYKVETLILTKEIVKDKITILLAPDFNKLDEVVINTDSRQQIIKMNENVARYLYHLKGWHQYQT